MDAVKYCEESRRMCEANKCAECPAEDGHFCKIALRYTNISSDAKVVIVEQWAKEHPAKTRQSEFLKLFPNAMVYASTKNIAINPCIVDTTLQGHCPTGRGCDACRREFWSQEVE